MPEKYHGLTTGFCLAVGAQFQDYVCDSHFFFFFFRAAPLAYGGSQAKGPMEAMASGHSHSHSNTRFKQHLQPTPQLTAMLDP